MINRMNCTSLQDKLLSGETVRSILRPTLMLLSWLGAVNVLKITRFAHH